tara:strand:- start:79 stop:537 length:459 start_codon:yes stop_codon:yes gene_type:complete
MKPSDSRCRATIYKNRALRYSGIGKTGLTMSTLRHQCEREADSGTSRCWKHQGEIHSHSYFDTKTIHPNATNPRRKTSMIDTPRTDDLAASIDPWTMVDEAFAEIKSHAERLERELAGIRAAFRDFQSAKDRFRSMQAEVKLGELINESTAQ